MRMSDKEPTYNEAAQRLEAIVAALERGGMGLDETLKLYEEGAALLKICQQELMSAEGRLNELRLEDLEQELQAQDAQTSD
ncbi:MAG: exodeoxyribonuclease VII small subunit [Candidatus Poseidoniales archaeon]|nr:MAG: exodeoxyribonuclease VII small subunit [Candidatus Poseidoniales archaeon]